MKKLIVASLIGASSWAALALLPTAPIASHPAQAQKKIPGFPSPADLTTMDTQALRKNRWELFVHLTADHGMALPRPVWETWYTKCDLHLSPVCDSQVLQGQEHTAFIGDSPQIDTPPAGENQRFSTVYYSPVAADFINKEKLSNAKVLQDILESDLDKAPLAPGELPMRFPKGSIIVKEIWEGFPIGASSAQNEFVSVYDPSDSQFDRDYVVDQGQLKPLSGWPRMHIITKQGVPDPTPDCAKTYSQNSALPIRCFYSKSYPQGCGPYMQENSPIQGGAPLGGGPCVVVLVGVHIITREVANWAWSTFWWTNQPDRITTMHVNDGPKMPPQYSHYMMQTTLGTTASQRTLESVFSPYLEGLRNGGRQSNCFGCHSAARYDPYCRFGPRCYGHNTGQGIEASGAEVAEEAPRTSQKPGPCVLRELVNNAPCLLKTDFIWSLATNQDRNTIQPMSLGLPHGIVPSVQLPSITPTSPASPHPEPK